MIEKFGHREKDDGLRKAKARPDDYLVTLDLFVACSDRAVRSDHSGRGACAVIFGGYAKLLKPDKNDMTDANMAVGARYAQVHHHAGQRSSQARDRFSTTSRRVSVTGTRVQRCREELERTWRLIDGCALASSVECTNGTEVRCSIWTLRRAAHLSCAHQERPPYEGHGRNRHACGRSRQRLGLPHSGFADYRPLWTARFLASTPCRLFRSR